jgi:hypothetical protein
MTEPTDAAKEEGRNYFYWVSAARVSAMAVGRYQHTNTRLITWHSGSSGREALVAMVRTTDLCAITSLGWAVGEARIDLRITELSKDQVVGLKFRHTLERMVSLGFAESATLTPGSRFSSRA